MSKKKPSKKEPGDKNPDTEGPGPTQIQLVTAATITQAQKGRMGLGLVLSYPLGWGPLTDAFAGRGAYELSMAKFLLVDGACVTGTTVVGNLLDKAPTPVNPGSGDHDEPGLNPDLDPAQSELGVPE